MLEALDKAEKELGEGQSDVALMLLAQAQITWINRLADEVDKLNASSG